MSREIIGSSESLISEQPFEVLKAKFLEMSGVLPNGEMQGWLREQSEQIESFSFDETWLNKAVETANALIKAGYKSLAGLLMNLIRHLKGSGGYGNDQASGDVADFFKMLEVVPEKGLLVFDYFVVRNLAAFVKGCKEKNIDLKRVKIRVPKAILAAQLLKIDQEKKGELDGALAELTRDNFIIEDEGHVGSVAWPSGKIAGWFGPRSYSIWPDKHEDNSAATAEAIVSDLREKLRQVEVGGVVHLNSAVEALFQALEARVDRDMMKLPSTISRDVAQRVFGLLEELGFEVEKVEGKAKRFVPVQELKAGFRGHEKEIAVMVMRRKEKRSWWSQIGTRFGNWWQRVFNSESFAIESAHNA